jgi:perosamine synthetase
MNKNLKKIPVFDISIGQNEKKYIKDCLDTSFVGQGPYVKEFENKFSNFVNCKYGITTTSGTTALHLALRTVDVKSGDEVLVSSSTNMACAFAIIYCNAKPVPIDIHKETWQMNTNLIEEKITKKTKAIMVVHLFGQAVDMDPVMKIAKKHNLKVIEDCAESHGVEYKGKKVGSIGDVGAFSFFSNKTITCGEGGMVTTNSEDLAQNARSLKNLCYGKINKFMHEGVGFNYRLPNVSAAMGLGQFNDIEEIFKQKNRIDRRYRKNLQNVKGLNIPVINKDTSNYIMWVFNLYLDEEFGIERDELTKKLKEINIDTRDAFVPINMQKIIQDDYGIKENDCPNANYIMKTGFYIPSGNTISDQDIDYVSEQILKLKK